MQEMFVFVTTEPDTGKGGLPWRAQEHLHPTKLWAQEVSSLRIHTPDHLGVPQLLKAAQLYSRAELTGTPTCFKSMPSKPQVDCTLGLR